jgi:hypothetical protein
MVLMGEIRPESERISWCDGVVGVFGGAAAAAASASACDIWLSKKKTELT